MNDTPLIWTARGNVPVDTLTYEHKWAYDGANLSLQETWRFEDGTLARNNCHMIGLPDMPIAITAEPGVGLTGAAMGADQARMQ